MMRIKHHVGALAAVAALLVSASAAAETRIVRGERGQELLSAFDDTAWVPVGGPAEKHIYVLYSPGCPISKRLREASRALEDHVQFRWVPHKEAGAKAVGEHRSETAMDAAFNGNPPAVDNRARAEARSAWNGAVAHNNIHLIGTDDRTYSWPTLIYPVDDGAAVTLGLPDFVDVIKRLATRPQAADHTPAALEAEVPVDPIDVSQEQVVNRGDEAIKFRAVPHASAPVRSTLDPGYQMSVVGGTEDGWVAVEALTDGTLGWARKQ